MLNIIIHLLILSSDSRHAIAVYGVVSGLVDFFKFAMPDLKLAKSLAGSGEDLLANRTVDL